MKTISSRPVVRRLAIASLIALLWLPEPGSANNEVVLKSMKFEGRTIQDVRVLSATPTEVTISFHGANVRKLDRQNLPPELKALYPYDAKAAAEYLKQQEIENAKKAEENRARQERNRQQQRVSLQRQQASLQSQIAALEAELKRINDQIDGYRRRVHRRRTASEVQDIARLEAQARDLKTRINGMRDQGRTIERQLLQ